MTRVSGSFDIVAKPIAPDAAGEPGGFSRIALDKRYHGSLDGEALGQMMAWGTGETSGAYVALEKVTGTLDGKRGSFVLAHQGVVAGGVATMKVTIVTGSGTDELSGIEGELTIRFAGKDHLYDLDYRLP